MKRNYISPESNNVAINTCQLMSGSAGERIESTGLSGNLNGGNAPLDLSGAK